MKMIVAESKDGYGGSYKRYVNPNAIRVIADTRDGTIIRFGKDDVLSVLTPASELVRQWEHCNDDDSIKKSESRNGSKNQ